MACSSKYAKKRKLPARQRNHFVSEFVSDGNTTDIVKSPRKVIRMSPASISVVSSEAKIH
jgi:hypothetical protein